jgi:hypothetical protein
VDAIEARQQQGQPGARHRHVVQAAIGIAVARRPGDRCLPPAAVEHRDMVEFESFGAVRGQQQQAALPSRASRPHSASHSMKCWRGRSAPPVSPVYSAAASSSIARTDAWPATGQPAIAGPLTRVARVVVQPVEQPLRVALAPELRAFFPRHLHRDAVQFAASCVAAPSHCHSRAITAQRAQSQSGVRLARRCNSPSTATACVLASPPTGRIWTRPFASGSMLRPCAAGRQLPARTIDADRVRRLHAVRRRRDQPVGGVDQVRRRAVVVDQMHGAGGIVGLEAADELDRSAAEGVDVLVIVADGEEIQARVLVASAAPGEGADQFVLLRPDVLVLVDQNPAEAAQQALALFVGLLWRQLIAAQQRDRLPADVVQRGSEAASLASSWSRPTKLAPTSRMARASQVRTLTARASSPIRSPSRWRICAAA